MFKQLSLTKKLTLMCVLIGTIVPALGFFIYVKSKQVKELNRRISDVKLAKTRELGELVFKFRSIRIQVRTIPVSGMSSQMIDHYSDLTKEAVGAFLEAKKKYASDIETEQERKLFLEFDKHWSEFLEFGQQILALAATHEQKDLVELARQIREVCPVKAAKVENAISDLINQQTKEVESLVAEAHELESQSILAILFGSAAGFTIALVLGALVSRAISKKLTLLADHLTQSSNQVSVAASSVSANGNKLASASTEQAAALQETVSAIEEISSMIAKNTENAKLSQTTASSSLTTAHAGHKLVEQLVHEVEEIERSTFELVDSVDQGNQEIGHIVSMISVIEQKTKIINDIVFQTKLLSFNASVEAARAGESGKGFAVVAEEVGNLAQTSGNAAKEIGDLLTSSIQRVQEIVAKSRESSSKQASTSKERVKRGLEVAKGCGESLSKILEEVKKVEHMAHEIATASQEQATGVSEVTKAMRQLDQVTQENASVSTSSAGSSEQLNRLAEKMKTLVDELYSTVQGSDLGATGREAPEHKLDLAS